MIDSQYIINKMLNELNEHYATYRDLYLFNNNDDTLEERNGTAPSWWFTNKEGDEFGLSFNSETVMIDYINQQFGDIEQFLLKKQQDG